MKQAEVIACLSRGKIILISSGKERQELHSAYAAEARARSGEAVPFVDVARGRRADELCYTLSVAGVASVFAQGPGGEERRLFSAQAEIRDLDFSFADEALTCAVQNADGSSAIALLADDGKGMRTVTEGDVIDRAPRWAPGGRGEIVYASAGIGRTKAGLRAALAPSSIHRLNLAQSTVEVLVADAKFDYCSPVPLADTLIYAIRRPYRGPARAASGVIPRLLASLRGNAARASVPAEAGAADELVRITAKGIEPMAAGVLAFDASTTGAVVYSTPRALFRLDPESAGQGEQIAELTHAEQLVIC